MYEIVSPLRSMVSMRTNEIIDLSNAEMPFFLVDFLKYEIRKIWIKKFLVIQQFFYICCSVHFRSTLVGNRNRYSERKRGDRHRVCRIWTKREFIIIPNSIIVELRHFFVRPSLPKKHHHARFLISDWISCIQVESFFKQFRLLKQKKQWCTFVYTHKSSLYFFLTFIICRRWLNL